MNQAQRITVLGATGSIGRSTLEVVARHEDRFQVVALTASRQVDELAGLCARHRAQFACIAEESLAPVLRRRLDSCGSPSTAVLAGREGLIRAATLSQVDSVMAAIVGAAGLESTLAAARAGKRILLANKEALVMAGPIFMDTVRQHGSTLLPIDSEHNAIFQCLPAAGPENASTRHVRRILLTGSGGPFRTRPLGDLKNVSPEEACAHPNWVMGKKISVDSATMMNKGLEIIEAHWLFGARPEQIEVVVHPQSVIHSMVEFADGSIIAQLGNPDMRTPIAQALAYPERIDAGVAFLDLFSVAALTFERPDFGRFPALRLAYGALQVGGTAPAILNAANEVGVAAFLAGTVPFLRITEIIEETLQRTAVSEIRGLEDVLEADRQARAFASMLLHRHHARVA